MRYLRRLIWYIASRLFILLILIGVLTVTFYYAKVIMMDEPIASLDQYFTTAWIERDEGLQQAVNGEGPYQNVNVTGFDHRISLKRVWCWPWEDSATATVVERIPSIDGKATSGSVPPWPGGTYTMILTRESGNWKIRNITALEQNTP